MRFKNFIFLIFSFLLSGCSTFFGKDGVFRSKDYDYLEADSIKEIQIPSGIESKELQPLYELPESLATDEFGDTIDLAEFEVPRPVSIKSEMSQVGAKLLTLDNKRWLYLNAPPSQIWPRTQNFISLKQMKLVDTDVAQGLIEITGYKHPEFENVESRFLIFIEKGILPETTEIRLVQKNVQPGEPAEKSVAWNTISENKEIENFLLKELAQSLAADLGNKSASLLGQEIGGKPKSGFVKGAEEPTLRLSLSKSRVAAVLSRSLDQSDYKVWEKSFERGVFYFGYLNEEQRSNYFSRKIGLGRSVPKKPKFKLEDVLNNLSSSEESKNTFQHLQTIKFGDGTYQKYGYLAVVVPKGADFHIVIRDSKGKKIPVEYAKDILLHLRKNLV